jgi:hypothetical protein
MRLIDIKKVEFKKRIIGLKVDKSSIKEAKAKRLKLKQNDIRKANTKSARDLKRKSKEQESDYFDNRLKAKDKEIQYETKRILEIEEEKAQLKYIIEKIKQHINKTK